MKFIHPLFSGPIIFEENIINVLVVENQKEFSAFIVDLLNQINGSVGEFVLFSGLKELELSKHIDLIIDIFTLDINQRKILTKLYSQLKEIAVWGEHYLETNSIIGDIVRYIESIIQTVQYPITYSTEIDIGAIFKLSEVKLETEYVTLTEKLLDYLGVMQEFFNTSLFIFVNLKSYLSEEEVDMVYQYVAYNKINVLLLENTMREKKTQEIIRIIDQDLCEI